MSKLNLCVIFGGQSPEHDISRRSVTSVLENLNKDKYNIHTIGITKKGQWYLYTGDYAKIIDGEWENDTDCLKKAFISPDPTDGGIVVFENDGTSLIKTDVIFPVLHGEYGEDGTIQGLFEMSGIKYVGMGVGASANGMDKTFSKIVFASAGIPQADWVTVLTDELSDIDTVMDNIENKLGYPCFVKPACTGSSVGVGKAADRESLKKALENASQFGRKILVEENIDGHEVECAVLGNSDVKASVVGEIIPVAEFYDFDAKYVDGTTKLQIPAELPTEISEKIREYAVTAFKALDGAGLSRVDFFVKNSDNSIVLNEINTLPGFTSISMYPKLWGECGIGYSELLDKLIEYAQKRQK